MTPQLQQAIKLLQLSTLDLQQEIQEALDSNPLLEVDDSSDHETVEKSKLDAEADAAATATTETSMDTNEALEKNELPDELPIDSTWDGILFRFISPCARPGLL